MGGYRWYPRVRIVPANGNEQQLDLSALMTDAGGPVLINVDYPQDRQDRIDVDRRADQTSFGFRPRVRMTFDINAMADHEHLAKIVQALHRTMDRQVFLSLDGGITEREMQMSRTPAPRPFNRKTIAGARYELELEAKDLLEEYPAMLPETGDCAQEFLHNGRMEDWTTPSVAPDFWAYTIGAGPAMTGSQETSTPHEGALSVKLDVVDASTYSDLHFFHVRGLKPGHWYRLTFWEKATAQRTTGARVNVRNQTKQRDLNTGWDGDPESWIDSTGGAGIRAQSENDWTQHTLLFRTEETHELTDEYFIFFPHTGMQDGDTLWIDTASLRGPVTPPGGTVW